MESLLPTPDCFGLPDQYTDWRPYQDQAIINTIDNPKRFTTLILATGCLAADTIIRYNRATLGRRETIQNLYRSFKGVRQNKRGRIYNWNPSIKTYVRSYTDTHIQLSEATEFMYSGVKAVCKLTLQDGKTLRATPEHRIMTNRGWVELQNLTKQDYVMCDTPKPCKSLKSTPRMRDIFVQNLWNHPYASKVKTKRHACGYTLRIEKHRAIYEAHINGLTLEEYKRILRYGPSTAITDLHFIDPSIFDIHHIDGDHYNNVVTNLRCLTKLEHQVKHSKQNKYNFNQGIPVYIRVKSIKPDGMDHTYDISVPGSQNFNANGMIVHNSGKSITCITNALIRGGRAVYLTSTKGLQRQLLNDFSSIGMVDIRGRNSYTCRIATDGSTCDHGPCITGYKCPLKEQGGCLYYDAYKAAKVAPLVVTNYSYWMNITEYGEGLGDFDTLICDEAHDSPDLVSSFMTITIDAAEPFVSSILKGGYLHYDIKAWKEWANAYLPAVESEINILTQEASNNGDLSRMQRKDLVYYKKLKKSMEGLINITDEWLWEVYNDKISFSPIWPAPYCEKALFQGIPHVLMTSATVNSKTISMLGVTDDDNNLYEYPHTFPLENRMLIHIPTIRLNFRSPPSDLNVWLNRIDQIIKPRLDRKGIIHTVSYDRRDMVCSRSKYKDYMMTHKSKNTEFMVQKFKDADPPAIFVSPSVTTGYDFHGDTCEYQIIGKIPYPDTRAAIIKARIKADYDYGPYITMQELVQATGRAVRSATDRAESFIIDDNVLWFLHMYKYLAPNWFKDAFVSRAVIPKPMDKI